MSKDVKIIILPSEDEAIINHNAGGGVGTKITNRNKAKVFPPQTSLYISSILKLKGYNVVFEDFNLRQNSFKYVRESIDNCECTYILFGSLPTIESDQALISSIDKGFRIIYVNAVASMFLNDLENIGLKAVIS